MINTPTVTMAERTHAVAAMAIGVVSHMSEGETGGGGWLLLESDSVNLTCLAETKT